MISEKLIPVGYLPDFAGNPVLASCMNCAHRVDESDGPEYGGPWDACEKEGLEFMGNLKSFPFKTSQKCCDLSIAYTVDWSEKVKESKECVYL